MSAATSIPCWFISIFWTVAFLASIFHGVYCFEVHEIKDKAKYHTAALIQQWCFNFLGSLVGWIALWFLIRRSGGLVEFFVILPCSRRLVGLRARSRGVRRGIWLLTFRDDSQYTQR